MSTKSIDSPKGLPQGILDNYEECRVIYDRKPTWEKLQEEDLWKMLCFCILSSNVPYEMAVSASLHLSQKGLLDTESRMDYARLIAWELSRPVYRPERKDGSLRVYRFPRKRAYDIAGAWKFLYLKSSGLSSLLRAKATPEAVRLGLVSTLPGIGFKEASHFLRDVKYADSLAVLDSHMISFLNLFVHRLPPSLNITPHRYIQLEALLVRFARKLGLCPAILDMAIWEYMRSS